MLKRIISHRLTGAAAFLLIFGGLLFVTLRDGKAVEKKKKGWLGVSVQELTPSLRDAMKVGNRPGLLITHVVENSPADDANLKEEDVILEFDRKAVEKADEFVRLVRNTPPDKKVKIKLIRAGETREVEVIIGERKTRRSGYGYTFGRGDDRNFILFGRPRLGVQVQKLNKDLATYFKVAENSGVLVLEVHEETPAEKAGLKAGDVITKIGDEKVTGPDDLIEALQDYEESDVVTIEYVRQGKTAKVEVELEYGDGHGFQIWGPGRHDIRIRRFDREGWREAEIMIPELERHLETLQQRIRDEVGQLRLRMDELPKKIEIRRSVII
jgi:predicted metalloprotease with PDZ domain